MSSDTPLYKSILHPLEADRLASLKKLNLLDSQPEAKFDDITQLVTQVFDVPIALVSLVDENRQWFLSNCGLKASETSRDVAFCAHAIHESEILVIENTATHPVMRFNPLVKGEPKIGFYAGAVIRDGAGLPLGTLCIIDIQPRAFDYNEQRKLIKFAQLVRKEMNIDEEHNQSRTRSSLASDRDPVTQALINESLYPEVERYINLNKPSIYYGLQLRIANLRTYSDAFGNFVSDQILFEACERISKILREFGEAIMGRDNNDCINIFFTPVLPETGFILSSLLDKCRQSLSRTIKTKAVNIEPHIVLSIVQLNHNSEHFRDAIRLAENAQKDLQITNNVEIVMIDNLFKRVLQDQRVITSELSRALEQGELRLVYQPKISSENKTIEGYECLLRWQDPQLGNVSPLDIMRAASETNLTFKLELWIFEQALLQFKLWQNANKPIKRLSINLTGNTLLNPVFIAKLGIWLEQYSIPDFRIDIEIVESSLFRDYQHALEVTKQLASMGITFSLDDFGTGFSNLSYLKTLPISTLKIDKSFIDDITHCKKSRALCSSIINMAKNLKMESVAEGVETEEQLTLLKELKCDLIQGFFFSRPLEKHMVTEFTI